MMARFPRTRRMLHSVNAGRWRTCAISLVIFATAIGGLGTTALDLGLQQVRPLAMPAPETNSRMVIDRNGRLLRAYTTDDGRWRLPVALGDLDPRYLAILKAFEDRRFEQHVGVDGRAMVRAVVQFVRHGRIVSGGSTLTMQVARLLSQEHLRTLSGKLRQMAWAIHLERQLSKDEILELYARLAPFGGNIEGVRAASLSYFGREPARLSIAEAALLVALPQSPEARRPDRFPDRARRARNHVLDVAAQRGVISPAEAKRAKAQPVPETRIAFPMFAPHLADRLIAATAAGMTDAGAAPPSLIKTTLNRTLQDRLQRIAASAAERTGPKLSVAILAADHTTGEILAHVGSPDFLSSSRAGAMDMTDAIRSPGSTLKPVIYGLGFDQGLIHPETLIEDRPTRFGAYAPRNFGEDYRGTVTIREALAASLNIPAVKVLDRLGPGRLVGRLNAIGIATQFPEDAAPNLTVALGGVGMTLHDLVALYAALAQGGQPRDLTSVPPTPKIVSRFPTVDTRPAARLVSNEAAYQLTEILRTAPPPPNARGGEIAFKTGTSYGHRDAWAVGYDGRHVIGVWIGRADATATPELVGRTSAAPILFDAFKSISSRRASFPPKPQGLTTGTAAELPPPLRRFTGDPEPLANGGFVLPPVRILFPPDRAVISFDTSAGEPVVLSAEGGVLPLTWMVDGKPMGAPQHSHQTVYAANGHGFVRFTVIDARGQVANTSVRLAE